MTIAGHTFDGATGVCSCGKTWIDMLDSREFWKPGEIGIAHSGALNLQECVELETRLASYWAALAGVCG